MSCWNIDWNAYTICIRVLTLCPLAPCRLCRTGETWSARTARSTSSAPREPRPSRTPHTGYGTPLPRTSNPPTSHPHTPCLSSRGWTFIITSTRIHMLTWITTTRVTTNSMWTPTTASSCWAAAATRWPTPSTEASRAPTTAAGPTTARSTGPRCSSPLEVPMTYTTPPPSYLSRVPASALMKPTR